MLRDRLRQGHLHGGDRCGSPDQLFVAVERVADCLLLAMEKGMRQELHNVVFVCDDAAQLGDMFAPGEVDRMYINFCDPWPSKKHAKRRLTYEGFLRSYRDFLKDGGVIEFKSDNRPLFDFSLTQFERAGYALSEVTYDLHKEYSDIIMTDYEARFVAEGVKIHRCVATKVELPTELGEPPCCRCWTICRTSWTTSPTAWTTCCGKIEAG